MGIFSDRQRKGMSLQRPLTFTFSPFVVLIRRD